MLHALESNAQKNRFIFNEQVNKGITENLIFRAINVQGTRIKTINISAIAFCINY